MNQQVFFIFPVCLAAVFLNAPAANAEVLEADEQHFVVKHEVVVPLNTKASYKLLGKPSQWWSSAHTWSGDAKNMRLQLKAGGCFCEVWKGNSVVHAQVIHAQPGSLLRMQGAFGPLQDMAVTAVLSYQLKKDGTGTKLEMTYRVSGNASHKFGSLAAIVDKVLGEQMEGFRKTASK
jgi:uncharacterized protein YndB with AHSA1/START domain